MPGHVVPAQVVHRDQEDVGRAGQKRRREKEESQKARASHFEAPSLSANVLYALVRFARAKRRSGLLSIKL